MQAGARLSLPQTSPAAACQFVGDGLDAGFQFVSVRIAPAAIIAQRFHPGDADGEFSQAFAPRTTESYR